MCNKVLWLIQRRGFFFSSFIKIYQRLIIGLVKLAKVGFTSYDLKRFNQK